MAAPTNTSAGTATALGPSPNSISQRVDDAGTTYDVYFRFTPPSDGVWGFWFEGDLAVYMPTVTLYQEDGVTPYVPVIGGGTAINKRLQVPCTAGDDVVFKVATNAGNPSPANLVASVIDAPSDGAAAGDYLINDDTDGMPGAVMDPSSGAVKSFILGMANGEGGAILPSGRFALTRDDENSPDDGKLDIYNVQRTLRQTVDLGLNASGILGAGGSFFYPVDDGAFPAIVYQIDEDGATVQSWTTIGNTIYHLAASRDDAILYFVDDFPGVRIKRHDLVNDVALTNLYALAAHEQLPSGNENLLVLSDGTILIGVRGVAPGPVFWQVRHLSAAGALLHTYDLTAYGTLNRIALNKADSALSFHAWSVHNTNYSNMQEVLIADGSIVDGTGDIPQYEHGAYRPAATLTPEAEFGPSFSCPFLVLRGAHGSLTVTKAGPPGETTVFEFSGVGISPTSFSLAPGESETFDLLSPGGGYQISELTPDGWTVIYSSSNGSPADNLIVVEGETTVLTVTNRPTTHAGVGHPGGVSSEECECCVSTKIDVINQALLKIGVSQTIVSLTEESREAYTGNLLYEPALKETLRNHPWGFATKYARAVDAEDEDDAMYLFAGGADAPINGDWLYAYNYPEDCLFARRIVGAKGRQFDPDPIPFRPGRLWNTDTDRWDDETTYEVGALVISGSTLYVAIAENTDQVPPNATYWRAITDADTQLIFSNQEDAVLEYTAFVECSINFSDALFEDALSWKLAEKMAPSLSKIDGLAVRCHQMFLATLDTALNVSSREQQQEKPGDSDWILAR